jgi:hypothetical protein
MKRRGPYIRTLPRSIEPTEYVLNLVNAIRTAAEEYGAKAGFHKKNGEYFFGVMIPKPEEIPGETVESAENRRAQAAQEWREWKEWDQSIERGRRFLDHLQKRRATE